MTDTDGVADSAFNYLARNLIALVVDPIASSAPERVTLRGLGRVNDQRTRVMLSIDAPWHAGVAIEYPLLTEDHAVADIRSIVDHVRSITPGDLADVMVSSPLLDGHSNAVISAAELAFDPARAHQSTDLGLFSLLSLMVHGGGFPWFEDVFSFNGFAIRSRDLLRLYLKVADSGECWGVDLRSDEASMGWTKYGSVHHELVPMVRSRDIFNLPVLSGKDDYCDRAFDLDSWLRGRATG